MDAQTGCLLAAWSALHIIGLVAAVISRCAVDGRIGRLNNLLLCVAFLAIAGLAALQVANTFPLSLLSALTLGLMVIAAVYEFRPEPENRVLTKVLAAYDC